MTDTTDGRRGSSARASRNSIRLDGEELGRYLNEPRTMVLATIGSSGLPHQVAMFFVMDDGRPTFWSYRKAQKVRNIERDPRVGCLVEDGREHDELRGVQFAGVARLSTDPADVGRVWRRLTEKYRGSVTEDEIANFHRQADKRCVITVDVERMVSWDHRKLPTVQ